MTMIEGMVAGLFLALLVWVGLIYLRDYMRKNKRSAAPVVDLEEFVKPSPFTWDDREQR